MQSSGDQERSTLLTNDVDYWADNNFMISILQAFCGQHPLVMPTHIDSPALRGSFWGGDSQRGKSSSILEYPDFPCRARTASISSLNSERSSLISCRKKQIETAGNQATHRCSLLSR